MPKPVVVALLRASRGRHEGDHRRFPHAAQLLKDDGESADVTTTRAGKCRMSMGTAPVKKRTALLRTLKQIFRSHRSRPLSEVIAKINPILRGWVQYFAVGHSSRCFSYIRDWVEKKIRHHLARASQRHGFGWKRWSSAWLYGTLGLFAEYRVAY
jgi:hypothetical protein